MASDPSDEFAAFNAEYRSTLPERLREIDTLWSELRHGDVTPERLHALVRRLHGIAGSAGTFGLPQLSQVASAAEELLNPYCERAAMPDEKDTRRFENLLSELRQAAG